MKLKAWQGDVILGIVSIVIGIVIIILNNMQGLQLMKNGQPGPGMFPVICAVAVMICGALLLVEVRARIRKQQQTGKEDPDVEGNVINIKELRTVAFFTVLGVLTLVLTEYIGLLTCLCLCMIAYIKFEGKDPLWKAALLGIGCTVFLWLVFVLFLNIPVPEGPLGF